MPSGNAGASLIHLNRPAQLSTPVVYPRLEVVVSDEEFVSEGQCQISSEYSGSLVTSRLTGSSLADLLDSFVHSVPAAAMCRDQQDRLELREAGAPRANLSRARREWSLHLEHELGEHGLLCRLAAFGPTCAARGQTEI